MLSDPNTGVLADLFLQWSGVNNASFSDVPESGSSRLYKRISARGFSAIGVVNSDVKENNAFLNIAKHLRNCSLPVPEVFAVNDIQTAYIQQDLGDLSLFDMFQDNRDNQVLPDRLTSLLGKIVDILPLIQFEGYRNFDFSVCYPRQSFDNQSMHWDLNYFKYSFLKLVSLPFDEQGLEDDFSKLIQHLSLADQNWFMYRDFQSRNIMVVNDDPWFIDFQGGRKGFPAYDLASLLFDAKARIPADTRTALYLRYARNIESRYGLRKETLDLYFPGFLLIRILQALGAFGFRGIIEGKTEFLQR